MGHKKVASILFGGKYFQSEFNDAFFAGDVSNLGGTFAGVLTAQAVNAVKTMNLAGNAVAVSQTAKVSRYPSSGALPEDTTRTLLSFSINVPSTHIAIVQYEGTLENSDNDDSQYNFTYDRKIFHNGAEVGAVVGRPLGGVWVAPKRETYRFARVLTPGINSFAITHWTSPGATTPYGYYKDLILSVLYFKK
ncbi:MAG: hypothetical protein ACRBBW_20520 [Cellvibrionaceae bacterium]